MRLRNVKGAKELLAQHDKVFEEPEKFKGKWNEIFNNPNPIHIEIGMGKGQFIIGLAQKNPHINYIGFEKYSSVLARAIEKIDETDLNNLRVVRMDAEHLDDVFKTDEIQKIYLNFSDPWPKDRHEKRRLTHKRFLDIYEQVLQRKGLIQLKTDNKALFDFSLEQFKLCDWDLENLTYDLHNTNLRVNNIMTEYEEKFVGLGIPICHVQAKK
jgi:tRNA (guanine-N7-)-methyltransferase